MCHPATAVHAGTAKRLICIKSSPSATSAVCSAPRHAHGCAGFLGNALSSPIVVCPSTGDNSSNVDSPACMLTALAHTISHIRAAITQVREPANAVKALMAAAALLPAAAFQAISERLPDAIFDGLLANWNQVLTTARMSGPTGPHICATFMWSHGHCGDALFSSHFYSLFQPCLHARLASAH